MSVMNSRRLTRPLRYTRMPKHQMSTPSRKQLLHRKVPPHAMSAFSCGSVVQPEAVAVAAVPKMPALWQEPTLQVITTAAKVLNTSFNYLIDLREQRR